VQNGTGDEPQSNSHPTVHSARPFGTPEGDIVVYAGNRNHRYASRLDKLADGVSVIGAGLVDALRVHGTPDAPRATFVLIARDGAATYAALSTETYEEFFGYLVDGGQVSLHGINRRPFEDGPPYIQVTDVEPHFD
jgi:hypothetical protein